MVSATTVAWHRQSDEYPAKGFNTQDGRPAPSRSRDQSLPADARPRHGKLSDVKLTDRLGERELALRDLAWAVCVFLHVDRERHSL